MRLRRNFRPRPRPDKFQPRYAGMNCQTALAMEARMVDPLDRVNVRVELPRRKMK